MAINEAKRCIVCKHKPCVSGCPVNVRIPEFIEQVANGDFEKAYEIITSTNALPQFADMFAHRKHSARVNALRYQK